MKKRFYYTLIILLTVFCSSSFAQETATPRKGDGIGSFLQRHNRPGKEYRQKFIEINKGKLGKDNALILGRSYTLPPRVSGKKSGSIGKEPLFGKKYEQYTVQSDRLAGACFFLVGGHGGPDCGAIGKAGNKELHEDEYAYDIVLRLARNLLIEGATVHIIIQDAKDGIRDEAYLKNSKRETCMGDPIPLNQVKRLQQRCDKINALSRKAKEKYQRAVFVHLDSRNKSHQTDVYFYHAPENNSSKKLANTIRNTFEEQYRKHQPSRGFKGTVSPRGLFVLNNTKPVSVFAELGNIQNEFDQRRFIHEANRQALAHWLCRGLIRDYEETKK